MVEKRELAAGGIIISMCGGRCRWTVETMADGRPRVLCYDGTWVVEIIELRINRVCVCVVVVVVMMCDV
jgi:hypothetical protein